MPIPFYRNTGEMLRQWRRIGLPGGKPTVSGGDMDPVSIFPGLASSPFRITSPPTIQYNGFAWAAGESHRWWEAHPQAGHYWPSGLTQDWSVDVVIAAYATLGFSPCSDGLPELGREKIAIYIKDGEPTHAARLLPNGLWTSKLGAEDDLEHTLDGLVGSEYGLPDVFLSRPLSAIP
jgi:hypothetical protein